MSAPADRSHLEPYRVFFPLGIALGILGVGVWPLARLAPSVAPGGAAHVGIQIQGFILAFAAGFLLTAVPRMTGGPAPGARLQLLLAGLIAASAAAFWIRADLAAEGISFAAMALLVGLGLRTVRRRRGPLPAPFAAVALALAAGLAGAGLAFLVVAGVAPGRLALLARRLLDEGMALVLVLGVSGKLAPMLLERDRPAPLPRWAHGVAGVAILASVVGEYGFGLPGGEWVRALAVALVLVPGGRLWEWPTRPATSIATWVAEWLVVLGLVLVASFPGLHVAMLHVVFVGGFSLLVLAVGTRVVVAHRGYPRTVETRSRILWSAGILVLIAALTRAAAPLTGPGFMDHLAFAGVLWIAGFGIWGAVLVWRIATPRSPDDRTGP